MSELLLELFCEEIPARLQVRAADDLRRLMVDGLKARGLDVGAARSCVTPRRMTLVVADVPEMSPAISDERKGPRIDAPEKALQGFLKAAGLASVDEAEVVKDEKKGDYYVARIEKPGRSAAEIIAEALRETILNFPWAKAMRFNAKLASGGELRWIRPLHSIVLLLDGAVVPFEIAGIASGNVTRGHRFMGGEPFTVSGFDDYVAKLRDRKVILDFAERVAAINEGANALAKDAKLTLVEDEGLAAENAGLTEWPTVLMGTFDKSFLDVPAECLTSAMRMHQKCFSLRQGKKLANRFLLVTNLEAEDGGKVIVAGNEKVIAARLSDAKFFWETDLKKTLDDMRDELKGITFHEKLGTQFERTERIKELADTIAEEQELCEAALALRAGELSKADLVSGMVGEFPELQGLMGRYYAEAERMNPEIARAIELHYKPKGPTDSLPLESEGDGAAVAVALADKLDMLVGFWTIGEKPTGSGDPYQLRRAALGVIRIVLENDLRLPLLRYTVPALAFMHGNIGGRNASKERADIQEQLLASPVSIATKLQVVSELGQMNAPSQSVVEQIVYEAHTKAVDLLSFFADRLKVYLRDKGARHDLIDAIFSLPGQDDLALIVKRVEALSELLATDDGVNLLAGVKRAQNILSIEEKKDKTSHAGDYDAALLQADEEKVLAAAIDKVKDDTAAALGVENFAGAMRALAELRAPVDAFFDKVTVNADDPALRQNRLHLLSQIRAATLNVADFTKIAS
ncbi:glycine--tRNA ligase subunit beta [Hyphomicrobium sp. D-2]|uniref:glycine--tRNA ligase subunit beta n=1 Tax=Hyphomicrobium sp. D-2 TaxID=3041621 RepID=UPI0024562630|nr:glycine--tRNA ligase subunit beta [Hyphomicrobium sp. D-2]MDH4983788.1 glycine--tRNA ligase subunit beta [Hyphomicrobium sp. D-2]